MITLHLITLTLRSDNYHFDDVTYDAIEKDKVFEIQEETRWEMTPSILTKETLMNIIATRKDYWKLSIYCRTGDVIEAKDKLVTEMRLKIGYAMEDLNKKSEILSKIDYNDNK